MWDVTVADTLVQSYVAAISRQAEAAADAAETRKQYEALADRLIVQPIRFKTMRSWGAGARAFLTEVSSPVAVLFVYLSPF